MDTHGPNSCSPEDRRKVYEDHVKGLEFEHQLIDRKITWLLTSQTILFASLGLTLQAPALKLVRIMAGVGLVICFIIGIGLVGNITAKWFVYSDYKKFVVDARKVPWGVRGTKRVEFGVRTYTTWLGVFADLAIPLTFAIAWLLVLVLSADIVEAAETGSTAP